MNKYLALSTIVINSLSQTEAKGSIAGVKLVDKKDAASCNGYQMAGSYIHPLTMESIASIRF